MNLFTAGTLAWLALLHHETARGTGHAG